MRIEGCWESDGLRLSDLRQNCADNRTGNIFSACCRSFGDGALTEPEIHSPRNSIFVDLFFSLSLHSAITTSLWGEENSFLPFCFRSPFDAMIGDTFQFILISPRKLIKVISICECIKITFQDYIFCVPCLLLLRVANRIGSENTKVFFFCAGVFLSHQPNRLFLFPKLIKSAQDSDQC